MAKVSKRKEELGSTKWFTIETGIRLKNLHGPFYPNTSLKYILFSFEHANNAALLQAGTDLGSAGP